VTDYRAIGPNTGDAVGLCACCRHAAVQTTARGSRFYRCRLSETGDYPRYPRLPVLACPGYDPATGTGTSR